MLGLLLACQERGPVCLPGLPLSPFSSPLPYRERTMPAPTITFLPTLHPHPPPLFPATLQMAHYANDCWDGEIETSYGWVECVGLADRSAYDLTAHAKMSKIDLNAYEKFPEPRMVDLLKVGGWGEGVGRGREMGGENVEELGVEVCEWDRLSNDVGAG